MGSSIKIKLIVLVKYWSEHATKILNYVMRGMVGRKLLESCDLYVSKAAKKICFLLWITFSQVFLITKETLLQVRINQNFILLQEISKQCVEPAISHQTLCCNQKISSKCEKNALPIYALGRNTRPFVTLQMNSFRRLYFLNSSVTYSANTNGTYR